MVTVRHMGYSFQLAARDLLYAQSHRHDSICYTNCGSLAGTRNSSVDPPSGIVPTTHRTMCGRSTTELPKKKDMIEIIEHIT